MRDDAQQWEWVAAAEMDKRRAAEARVAELERERDELRAAYLRWADLAFKNRDELNAALAHEEETVHPYYAARVATGLPTTACPRCGKTDGYHASGCPSVAREEEK